MTSNLKKSKKSDRLNYAKQACEDHGNFSMVPNCIYEMGLTWQEREVWLYLNRLPTWEHPNVEDIRRTLGMKKEGVLESIESLCQKNMLVVEGERRERKFHLTHPAHWHHEIPQKQYSEKNGKKTPRDIGDGVYKGVAVKRSKRNVPKGTFQRERSKGNVEKPQTFRLERSNVPNGTNAEQQTHEHQGREASLKTIQNSLIKYKTPFASSADAKVDCKRVTLKELDGVMRSLYDKYANMEVIQSVVRELVKIRSKEDVAKFLAHETAARQGLLQWNVQHRAAWKDRLNAFYDPSDDNQKVDPEQTYQPIYEATGSLDHCPY
jgi:hypothetical protein